MELEKGSVLKEGGVGINLLERPGANEVEGCGGYGADVYGRRTGSN
jgi:hypothetical protein